MYISEFKVIKNSFLINYLQIPSRNHHLPEVEEFGCSNDLLSRVVRHYLPPSGIIQGKLVLCEGPDKVHLRDFNDGDKQGLVPPEPGLGKGSSWVYPEKKILVQLHVAHHPQEEP